MGAKKKFSLRKDHPFPSNPILLPYIQIILNHNFSIRWVNEHFLRITKTSIEEMTGQRFETLESYICGISSLAVKIKQVQIGESHIIEEAVTILGKSLIYRFVYTHISMNTDHSLIILTDEDITNQKELEQEVRNSETRFRSLVDNIHGIVYRLNIHTNQFDYYNDQFRKITGHIPEPNSHGYFSPHFPFIIPEDRDRWNSIVQSSLTTGDPFEVKYRIQHINGNIIHVLGRGQPVYDESDHPIYIDGIIFDISEIKKIEQKLYNSEQNYRILTEASPDIIFVIDKDDNILFVNSIGANFLHLPAHKIIGKPRSIFFHQIFGQHTMKTSCTC